MNWFGTARYRLITSVTGLTMSLRLSLDLLDPPGRAHHLGSTPPTSKGLVRDPLKKLWKILMAGGDWNPGYGGGRCKTLNFSRNLGVKTIIICIFQSMVHQEQASFTLYGFRCPICAGDFVYQYDIIKIYAYALLYTSSLQPAGVLL